MTAEVAVLNRQAVALAADSAVTLSFGVEGRRREKIFTSANKVFALSKFNPVGVMVYGNASFMGMPWETVIKDYRKSLDTKSFSSLPEYADDFLRHLRTAPHLASRDDESRHVISNLVGYFSVLADQVEERANEANVGNNDSAVRKIAEDVIVKYRDMWSKAKSVAKITKTAKERLQKFVAQFLPEARERAFEKIPLSQKASDALRELASLLFLRHGTTRRPGNCGIVVAGFGSDDMYPRLRAVDVDGRVAGVLHAAQRQSIDIGSESEAAIIPFAQREVVDTFLDGIDPRYRHEIERDFAAILKALPKIVLTEVDSLSKQDRDAIVKRAQKTVQQQFDEYVKRLSDLRTRRYSSPVINTVIALPKDELAEMAEAFVNLTSLKRRVSLDSETVGGPVDVAVISKGDGLIWIRRKHYFSPELNRQFFANYNSENTDVQKPGD